MKTSLMLLITASLIAGAERIYTFSPGGNARVELRVTKTGLLSGKQHLFVFDRFSGKLDFDSERPENSRVSLSIDSASIVCKDTWLSAKDLRKVQEYALKDMLDATKNPAITFTSSGVRKSANGFVVSGTLTIRGIAKPSFVSVVMNAGAEDRPSFAGSATIRLTDFGLKPPSAALGTIGTKNEMSFTFVLVGSH